MRRPWLIVTLVVCAAGCFDTHGTGDDGGVLVRPDGGVSPPDFDGGGAECRTTTEASVLELRCPATGVAGEHVTVELDTTPPWCCSSGAVSAVFGQRTPNEFGAMLAWTACDCCDGCRCIGPIQTVVGQVGPLAPGTNVVEAYGVTCTIEASAAAACSAPFGGTDYRAPRHLIEGQQLSATLTAPDSRSCSCTPRVATGLGDYSFALELCDCCDECDCIDPGYQSSVVVAPPPLGVHAVTIPHGATEIEVHPRSQCHDIAASSVTIVTPDDGLIVTGPRLTWAHVSGQELVCCAAPEPAVEQTTLADGTIELRLLSCALDPCDCDPGTPTPTDAWHSLGELGPGTYSLRVGSVATSFFVP